MRQRCLAYYACPRVLSDSSAAHSAGHIRTNSADRTITLAAVEVHLRAAAVQEARPAILPLIVNGYARYGAVLLQAARRTLHQRARGAR